MGRRSVQSSHALELARATYDMRQTAALCVVIEHEIARRALSAIAVIEGLMLDPAVPPAVRLDAAREFLDRSVGKPAIRAEITTLSPTADDRTTAREIEAARQDADIFMEFNNYVMRRIPFAQWPERVREIAGDAGSVFAEVDNE
jgi:hypothetical protein